ncbi:hypothetical protein J7J13_04060 [bacterium]|nr:hypothetical protein [bacterium]
MNKKILVSIIVLVLLITGGLFWLNIKSQKEITIQPSESVREDYSESNKKSSNQSSTSDLSSKASATDD